MVLNRYGFDVELNQVKEKTKTEWLVYKEQSIGMTSPDYISRTLGEFGVKSRMKSGSMKLLKHYVSENKPVIVLLRSSGTTWHYVVVIGYNEFMVTVADPSLGRKREMLNKDFIGAWSFSTDMNGKSVFAKCRSCQGTGRWIENFGPLGICEICSGTGNQPDYGSVLLRTADIYPFTMIVPKIGVRE
jgi:ABC-type bacteriocin/lantibiotic exporter with double-glycine peptidase domain